MNIIKIVKIKIFLVDNENTLGNSKIVMKVNFEIYLDHKRELVRQVYRKYLFITNLWIFPVNKTRITMLMYLSVFSVVNIIKKLKFNWLTIYLDFRCQHKLVAWGKSLFCQERFSYNINVKSLRTKLYLNLLKCDPIWCGKVQTKLRNVPTLYIKNIVG